MAAQCGLCVFVVWALCLSSACSISVSNLRHHRHRHGHRVHEPVTVQLCDGGDVCKSLSTTFNPLIPDAQTTQFIVKDPAAGAAGGSFIVEVTTDQTNYNMKVDENDRAAFFNAFIDSNKMPIPDRLDRVGVSIQNKFSPDAKYAKYVKNVQSQATEDVQKFLLAINLDYVPINKDFRNWEGLIGYLQGVYNDITKFVASDQTVKATLGDYTLDPATIIFNVMGPELPRSGSGYQWDALGKSAGSDFLVGGVSVGHLSNSHPDFLGTVGGFFVESNPPQDRPAKLYGITNHHVLDNLESKPDVCQPALAALYFKFKFANPDKLNCDDKPEPCCDVLGTKFVDGGAYDSNHKRIPAGIDVAAVEVNYANRPRVKCEIQKIGAVKGQKSASQLQLSDRVQKYGARTYYTEGFIRTLPNEQEPNSFWVQGLTDLKCDGANAQWLPYCVKDYFNDARGEFNAMANDNMNYAQVNLGDTFQSIQNSPRGYRMFGDRGDSGSFIMTPENEVAGLLYGGAWNIEFGLVDGQIKIRDLQQLVKAYTIDAVLTAVNKAALNNQGDGPKTQLEVCTANPIPAADADCSVTPFGCKYPQHCKFKMTCSGDGASRKCDTTCSLR